MAELFSIGEMSKIHHISIKTLRYYDAMGLFQPVEVKPESGYRYYSYHQFEQLNTIKFLKYLGIPLKEIKGYMSVHDKAEYLALLDKEQSIINKKLKVLQKMQESLQKQKEEVEYSQTIENFGEVFYVEKPERQVMRMKSDIRSNYDLEVALHKLKSMAFRDQPIVIGLVGLSMSQAKLKASIYDRYDSVFIITDDKIADEFKWVLPKCLYACIYFNDQDHSESPFYLDKMMHYIDDKGYDVVGDALERVIINDYKTNDPKDYLTEIQIPIRLK